MTPEEVAAVLVAHRGDRASSLRPGECSGNPGNRETPEDRCDTYRLAEFAQQQTEALVEAQRPHGYRYGAGPTGKVDQDSNFIPAEPCPYPTPFIRYTKPTCDRPLGHEPPHRFISHDGRTPLEVMPK